MSEVVITKRVEVAGCLFLLLCAAALIYWAVWGFDLTSLFFGRIAGYDKLIAQVDDAARTGQIAPDRETAQCNAAVPLHFGAFARYFLQGKPVPNCNGAFFEGLFGNAPPLTKPVIIVDLDRKRLDAINRLLPAPLRAPDVDAAATIVFIHCSRYKSGSYGALFPQTAYGLACGLLFVARKGQGGMQILSFSNIDGSPPEEIDARFSFGAVVADRPETAIQDDIVSRFHQTAR